jgi:HlyD family secretion protein
MLALVHHGDQVRLLCDNCPGNLTGKISFIAPQVEYTPPVIFSEANQAKLVVMVEARPKPEQAALLNPGLPIAVQPMSAGPPR